MLSSPVRGSGPPLLAVLILAGCGLETGGLPSAKGAGTGGSTPSTSTDPAGHGGAAATGTGGHGGVDAGTGDAGDAGLTTFASCKEVLAAHPGSASGVFTLVDDKQQPYQAYCEMTADGGGWALVLKIDGSKATFGYDADLWTKGGGLHPDKPELDTNEAQLASYWSVPFTQVRAGMTDAYITRWLVISLQKDSFLDAITSGGATVTGITGWEGLVGSGSLQTSCDWEGLNRQDLLRFGVVGDESWDCGWNSTPDSFIGFGAKPSFGAPSGNTAHYSPDHGDRDTKTFGYLMVR